MSTIIIHQPLSDSEWDRARADAQNTPCDIADCNGMEHDSLEVPSAWSHQVIREDFDGGAVYASVSITQGKVNSYMDHEGSGDMTAAEFRAEADKYEAYPAWLRSMADRMDTLNA